MEFNINIVANVIIIMKKYKHRVKDMILFILKYGYFPISYIYYYLVMILQGRVENILFVFLMQILWIIIMFSISNAVFRIGVNKYESQGG